MNKQGIIGFIITMSLSIVSTISIAQTDKLETALGEVDKGSYVILEVRMQLEDEFQTVEGNQSANLSRIAVFTGKNKDKEVLSKGFEGYNQVVNYLNDMKAAGFELEEAYPMKGNSLLITHYIFKKVKK